MPRDENILTEKYKFKDEEWGTDYPAVQDSTKKMKKGEYPQTVQCNIQDCYWQARGWCLNKYLSIDLDRKCESYKKERYP